jgi:hypothetical protein
LEDLQLPDRAETMSPSIKLFSAAVTLGVVVNAAPDAAQVTPAPILLQSRAINAIDPTSSGQIGVNPVSEELGDPSSYVLTNLSPNNPVLTWDGSVYHASHYLERCPTFTYSYLLVY